VDHHILEVGVVHTPAQQKVNNSEHVKGMTCVDELTNYSEPTTNTFI
jgi:hypothetical protein